MDPGEWSCWPTGCPVFVFKRMHAVACICGSLQYPGKCPLAFGVRTVAPDVAHTAYIHIHTQRERHLLALYLVS